MKILKKKRNVIIVIIILLLSINLVWGVFSIKGVHYAGKAYMHKPPGADITIVDFNQYGCDICQIAQSALKEALAQDGKVRYIPRILMRGDDIEKAAVHAVYASALQGKFIQMHYAIYENWPIKSHGELLSIADRLEIDTAQLQVDMNSEKVKQKIQEDEDYFAAWKLPSVPAFFIGKKILYIPNRDELPTVDIWLEKFQKARKK